MMHRGEAAATGVDPVMGARLFWAGMVLFFCLGAVAVLAPVLTPYGPWERFTPFAPPSGRHCLGTNDIGHDIMTELVYGARSSLLAGFGSGLLATIIGLLIGMIAGYYRGWREEILMGWTDIFLLLPRIPLIVILAALLKPSIWWATLLMGLLWWTTTARVVRAKVWQVRESGFVQSAVCLGFSHRWVMFAEILPHIILVVLPKFMLTVASAMIAEASISFLGLGDPSVKSWGMMLNFAFNKGGFINGLWWWFLPPAFCIILAVAAVTLIGYAVESTYDPVEMRIE